jgi:hypothetical protein
LPYNFGSISAGINTMPEPKRPLKVFLFRAHADREAVSALYTRLTTPALAGSARADGMDNPSAD